MSRPQCLNVRWAPAAQIFLTDESQINLAKERAYLHAFPFKVPPKLPWPPQPYVYTFRSEHEAICILRIDSSSDFELKGKLISRTLLEELKKTAYKEPELQSLPETSPEPWKFFYGPDHLNPMGAQAQEKEFITVLEQGGSVKQARIGVKTDELLALLKLKH